MVLIGSGDRVVAIISVDNTVVRKSKAKPSYPALSLGTSRSDFSGSSIIIVAPPPSGFSFVAHFWIHKGALDHPPRFWFCLVC